MKDDVNETDFINTESNSEEMEIFSVKEILLYSRRLTTDQYLRYINYDHYKTNIEDYDKNHIEILNKKNQQYENLFTEYSEQLRTIKELEKQIEDMKHKEKFH